MIKNRFRENTSKNQYFLIFLCFFAYTFSYFGKYSYSSNIALIMEDYNVSHADAGLVTTVFFFVYGAGQFINGMLAKKYNKRLIFPIGLTVSALCNISLFFHIPFSIIKYIWLVDAAALSVLWSSVIVIFSENLDEKHMKRSVIITGSTTALGTFLTYFVNFLFVKYLNYRYTFLFSGILLIAYSVFWFISYKPIKQEEKKQKEEVKINNVKAKSTITTTLVAFFVLVAMFCILSNFVKDGLQTWVPSILKETFGMEDDISILLSLVVPLLGTLSGVLCIAAKKISKDFIDMGVIFTTFILIFTGAILLTLKSSPYLALAMLALATLSGHCLNGMATNLAPLYMKDQMDSGKAAGFFNGFCYIGSTLSTYGLGLIADNSGWNGVFITLLVSTGGVFLVGVISSVILKNSSKKGA